MEDTPPKTDVSEATPTVNNDEVKATPTSGDAGTSPPVETEVIEATMHFNGVENGCGQEKDGCGQEKDGCGREESGRGQELPNNKGR